MIAPKTMLWVGFYIRLFYSFFALNTGLIHYFTGDALRFHEIAVLLSTGTQTGDQIGAGLGVDNAPLIGLFYPHFLGWVYHLTTESLIIGNILSCFAWLFSGYILLRIVDHFNIGRKNIAFLILIYVLLPSSLLNTSVGIREAFQLLFVNLSIYSALMIYLRKDIRYWFVLPVSIFLMGATHGALFAFGFFILAAVFISIQLREDTKLARSKVVGILLFIIIFAAYGISLFSEYVYDLEDGFGLAVQVYLKGSVLGYSTARAQYFSSVPDIASLSGILVFIPMALFNYLFQPFPWNISSPIDVILVSENLLRAFLIYTGLRSLFNKAIPSRFTLVFLIFSYFLLETIWSIGTTNWGTASRHHIPGLGLLLVMGFAYKDAYWFNRFPVRLRW